MDDIHEGCLITMQSVCRTTQVHARTRRAMRHASCVMRHACAAASSSSSLTRSKHHPCCSSTMMIMMILCSTCVCVLSSPNPRRYAPASLFRLVMCPHLLVSLGLITAHCLLLIVSCPFILSFVVLLSSQCYHCSRCPYLSTCSRCSH